MIQRKLITLKELEKKKLGYVENYNFKEEDDKSWSFEYMNKKAFILNIAEPINTSIITPFIMRRSQLGRICDELFDQVDHGFEPLNTEPFFNFSIEVISNMLDLKKMGSVENFINYVWDSIKTEDTIIVKTVAVLGDIITMIDISVEKQLGEFSLEEMQTIHNDFFQKIKSNGEGGYFIVKDGMAVPYKLKDDPEDKYDLANMIPINREEI